MRREARYIGKPKTTQLGGGNWMEPEEIITGPVALIEALLKHDYFEAVEDETSAIDEPVEDPVPLDYDFDDEDEE